MDTMEIEEIEFILNCPICMDEFDDPRILQCQHSFCEGCLSSYIKDRSKNNRAEIKSFPCPVCRRKTKLKDNVDDASAFERDLTKVTLLESKHILLEQEDDLPVERNTCEVQTMTTDTDSNTTHANGTQVKMGACRNALRGTSKTGNRQISSKSSDNRPMVNDLKHRGNRCQNTKSKNKITRQKKLGKRGNLKTDSVNENDLDDERIMELEFLDHLLVDLVLFPLYKQSSSYRKKVLAILLAAMLCLIYTICTYMTPFFSVFLSCVLLLTLRGEGRKAMSFCLGSEKKVRKYDVLLFHMFQCSVFLITFIALLYVFVLTAACKNTLSNALWKNDSVVSLHEFEGNFITSASNWLNTILIFNHRIKQMIVFILF